MRRLVIKAAIAAMAVATIAGCGSKPVNTGPKPVIKTIAVVPPATPASYSLQNLSAVTFLIPISQLGYAQSNADRTKALSAGLRDPGFKLDEVLTSAVVESLRKQGFEVSVLADVKRQQRRPDTLEQELSELPTKADAVLHLGFEDVGLESPRRTTDFLPRVIVNVASFVRQNESYPYDATLYYGVDATEPRPHHIPHEPKHAYASFDAAMADLAGVRAVLRHGAVALGTRIAEQAGAAFK